MTIQRSMTVKYIIEYNLWHFVVYIELIVLLVTFTNRYLVLEILWLALSI